MPCPALQQRPLPILTIGVVRNAGLPSDKGWREIVDARGTAPGARGIAGHDQDDHYHPKHTHKVSHGYENVAVIKDPTPQSGHKVDLQAMRCPGDSEPRCPALAGWRSGCLVHAVGVLYSRRA